MSIILYKEVVGNMYKDIVVLKINEYLAHNRVQLHGNCTVEFMQPTPPGGNKASCYCWHRQYSYLLKCSFLLIYRHQQESVIGILVDIQTSQESVIGNKQVNWNLKVLAWNWLCHFAYCIQISPSPILKKEGKTKQNQNWRSTGLTLLNLERWDKFLCSVVQSAAVISKFHLLWAFLGEWRTFCFCQCCVVIRILADVRLSYKFNVTPRSL